MANLAKYIVSLEAQTAKYVQEIDKANRKLDRFHKDQERAVQKIKTAFLSIGTAFAAAFSVRAIGQFAAASVRLADEIGKVSKAAGISAETLQELRFALGELGGVTSRQADVGLQRFNRQLGLAINGSREAEQSFQRLGVSLNSGSTGHALDATLKALGDIENDAQRAALAGRIFGEELGPKLAGALKGGSASMDEVRKQVTGLISDERVRQAEALNDAFYRLAGTIGGPLKEAAIATGFALGKMLGFVEDAPLETINRKIFETEQRIKDLTNAIEINQRQSREGFLGWLNAEGLNRDLARLQTDLLQAQMNLSVFRAAIAPVETGRAIASDFVMGFGERIGDIYDRFPALKLKRPEIDLDLLPEDALEEIFVNVKPISLDDLLKPVPEFKAAAMFDPLSQAGKQAAMSIGDNFRHAFADWLVDGEFKFKEFLKRLAAEFVTSQLFTGLGTILKGKGGGFLDAFFGGARASGGPVSAGKGYVVGEKGPEWFMPNVSGTIVPSGAGGANVNVTVHNHYDVGLESTQDLINANNGPMAAAVSAAVMKSLARPRMA
jgi:hypothetical protein